MDLPIPRGSEILAGYAYFVAQQADSGATQGWSAAHEFGTRKSFLYFTVLGRILAQVADGSADGDGKASLEALSTPLFKEGRRKWKIGSLFSSGFGEFPQRMALSLSLCHALVRRGRLSWILEPARQGQGQLTKELCQCLKARNP